MSQEGYDPIMTQGMTPELIQQLMQLGIIPEQLEQTQADILRGGDDQRHEGPQGRTTRGIYTAASPLEHIVSGMRRYKGRQDE